MKDHVIQGDFVNSYFQVRLKKEWFVFYTKSRHEKKVRDLLSKEGHEVFLPLQKVVREWSDRKKKVEVPLFNSYIFVRETAANLATVLQIPGIAWAVTFNGKPAVLRPDELEIIQRFIASGIYLEASGLPEHSFEPGDIVQIAGGPLSGISGTLTGSANNRKLNVLLEGIHQVIRMEIGDMLLKKV
jgi:transcriptional antiterminator NusG